MSPYQKPWSYYNLHLLQRPLENPICNLSQFEKWKTTSFPQ